jgi:hypothetical protein
MAEADGTNHANGDRAVDHYSAARIQGFTTALDGYRIHRPNLSAVAPWFDVTNSDQRYWIRTHRWKTPAHFSEYPP